MPTYVMRNGKIVLKDRANNSAVHHAISDDLGQQLEHHGYADGRKTDSKSTFRRWTKEAGLVEKGNDRESAPRNLGQDPLQLVKDVAEARNMVLNGYKPHKSREEQ